MATHSSETMKVKSSAYFLLLLICLSLSQLLSVVSQDDLSSDPEPKEYLDPHNAARAEIGVAPLTWDTTLEAYAKKYAAVRSSDCALIHSHGPYGENIYWGEGEGYTSAAAGVQYWVDEKDSYDYGSNNCINGVDCLHYTQIVWSGSKKLGCARSKCSDTKIFITCNYDPTGNIVGEKPY